MKSWFKPIFIFLLVLGLIGTVLTLSGIIPIMASKGHWRITKWFLNFTKERYVATYSMGVEEKNLKDPAMVLRGAGHYEIGCRQCHGGPEEVSFLGLHTTPKAPFLPPRIKRWSANELFQIVKHGIKLTAMPAWPSLERDDEVWSMVAFLKKLPDLDKESYKKLVYVGEGPMTISPSPFSGLTSRNLLMICANCHGLDGNGRGVGAFPKIAGQNEEYLVEGLLAYKEGMRHSGTMELVAHALSVEMIKELSKYYSSMKRKPAFNKDSLTDEERNSAVKRGEKIARFGVPEQKVASCMGCHGPNESGVTQEGYFPDLRGQPSSYLINQLKLFLQDKRGGGHRAILMKKAVPNLTPLQIKDVALYYESLMHPDVMSE